MVWPLSNTTDSIAPFPGVVTGASVAVWFGLIVFLSSPVEGPFACAVATHFDEPAAGVFTVAVSPSSDSVGVTVSPLTVQTHERS